MGRSKVEILLVAGFFLFIVFGCSAYYPADEIRSYALANNANKLDDIFTNEMPVKRLCNRNDWHRKECAEILLDTAAVKNCNTESVEVLLKHGFDKYISMADDFSIWRFAYNGCEDIVFLMLENMPYSVEIPPRKLNNLVQPLIRKKKWRILNKYRHQITPTMMSEIGLQMLIIMHQEKSSSDKSYKSVVEFAKITMKKNREYCGKSKKIYRDNCRSADEVFAVLYPDEAEAIRQENERERKRLEAIKNEEMKKSLYRTPPSMAETDTYESRVLEAPADIYWEPEDPGQEYLDEWCSAAWQFKKGNKHIRYLVNIGNATYYADAEKAMGDYAWAYSQITGHLPNYVDCGYDDAESRALRKRQKK